MDMILIILMIYGINRYINPINLITYSIKTMMSLASGLFTGLMYVATNPYMHMLADLSFIGAKKLCNLGIDCLTTSPGMILASGTLAYYMITSALETVGITGLETLFSTLAPIAGLGYGIYNGVNSIYNYFFNNRPNQLVGQNLQIDRGILEEDLRFLEQDTQAAGQRFSPSYVDKLRDMRKQRQLEVGHLAD